MKKITRKLPKHIAIIMDGNGRWAEQKKLPRFKGHEEGARRVRAITEECADIGIKQLTLYALSTENMLKRPKIEKEFLMELLKLYLRKERGTFMKNGIIFKTIGRIWELPEDVQAEINKLKKITSINKKMVLCLALNYSGRAEIVDAVNHIIAGAKTDRKVTEKELGRYFYDPEMPEPDLLIRTGGELRISNFLLWQVAYTELWVTPTLWPDFTVGTLYEAMQEYSKRHRKFGGL